MNKIFEQALSEMNIDEIMKDTLKSNIEDAIKKTIGDTFSWNGAGKKAIEEKIASEMNVNLGGMNFQKYNALLSKQIEDTVTQVIKNEMDTETRKILLEHRHIKPIQSIKDILSKFSNSYEVECEGDHVQGTIRIEVEECESYFSNTPTGWKDVKIEVEFDEGQETSFSIELHVYKDGSITSINCDDKFEASNLYDTFNNIYKVGAKILIEDDIEDEEYDLTCGCDY